MHSSFTGIWNTSVSFFPFKATVPNTTLSSLSISLFPPFLRGKVIRCEFLQLHSLFQLFTLSPTPLLSKCHSDSFQDTYFLYPKLETKKQQLAFSTVSFPQQTSSRSVFFKLLQDTTLLLKNLLKYSTSSLFVKKIH